MRVEKTVDVPARTRLETDYIECEICKARTADEENWGGKNFGVDEVTITLEKGKRYPEGGSITTTIIDLCPDCFRTKLLPWLQSQGGQSREREVDF